MVVPYGPAGNGMFMMMVSMHTYSLLQVIGIIGITEWGILTDGVCGVALGAARGAGIMEPTGDIIGDGTTMVTCGMTHGTIITMAIIPVGITVLTMASIPVSEWASPDGVE